MSRWAKWLWFVVFAVALLIITMAIYFMNKPPAPALPIPSGPPLAPSPSGNGHAGDSSASATQQAPHPR
jgi:hypothetical protein